MEDIQQQHAEQQPLLEQVEPQADLVQEQKVAEQMRPVVLYKGIQQREAGQLQCPIHKGLMHDPVGTGKCKHVFCRSCLASWVELQGHCPLDSRPAQVDQLVRADAAADKINALLIHCRWGVVQDEETGAWMAASGEGFCPALITIGDRKAHEDSCAYRPASATEAGGVGAASQLMQRLQFPHMHVNVEQVMLTLKSNLTRFERVLAERMEVLLSQVRDLIEEQNIQRIRAGASGAVNNFKEEMEAAIAGLMEKQAPLFRSIASKSESLCSDASNAARAKGSALYEGAMHMRNQAAEAGGEAINRLDILAQELMGEVKFALMRSLETPSCPAPPPPPPADCVFEEVQEEEESSDTDTDSDSDTESESESEEDEAEAEPHVTAPASVSIDDAEWDDCPSWIPAQPTLRTPPSYPPPLPPRSDKKKN